MKPYGYTRAIVCFGIAALSCTFTGRANAEEASFRRPSSLFSDVKANKIGDVLSIIISESNSATKSTKTDTKKQSKTNTSGQATTGALEGLFPGASGSLDLSNQYNGQGSTVRNGTLNSRISVKVIDVLPGGGLVVEGSKTIEVNEDIEVVNISGVVRTHDITSQNTVYSYQVANAKITYKGKGTISQGHRPGFFTRLVNWIL